ncbi:MAG TPA: c-type cytochrome [Alcanivoracaceae bacterium]|nr:c-type cytochrome [Alcanivoracaceae bacterium]
MKKILSTLAVGLWAFSSATAVQAESAKVPVQLPDFSEGSYIHDAPTLEGLEEDDTIHPELKRVIRRGHDLFVNTQQLRGEYVFNDMNCSSCHMGEGRMPWAAPVWPAVTTLPNYRGKNDHVNSVEERIAGCFSFSMNGKSPEYGSDNMVALVTYHQWMATGAKVYEKGKIGGRGYGREVLGKPAETPSYERGEKLYAENCSICHGDNGQGLKVNGKVQFPPLWGDNSYNWGAGIVRIDNAAAFIKHNMPLGQPGSLSDQEAWDIAQFMNSQERPQDPRFVDDVETTRKMFGDTFHKNTMYGKKVNGRVLGDHKNTGEKPFLKPETLRPRTFE